MDEAEAQRRLFQHLECGRVGESSGVEEGLNQLGLALEAVTRSADEDPGLVRWSKEQLEQLVGILIRLCWDLQGDEDAGEKKVLRKIFALALQLSVQGLESSLRSDEQLQRKFVQLLQAVLLGEKITREPHFSSAGFPTNFLSSLSKFVHGSQVYIEQQTNESHTDDARWSQNILAVLSNHQHFCDERPTGRRDSLAGKRQTLIDATQHYAIVSFGCFRRLTALCVDLVTTDLEADVLYERVSLATEILTYLTKLSSVSSYRAFVPDTVAEIVKLVTALPALIKLSAQSADGYEVHEPSSKALPIFMDTVIGFCELLYPDQVLAQNVRTFLAAVFIDELEGIKLRQDGLEQRFFVVCAPLFVSCFLRLFRDDQFHMPDGKPRRLLAGEESVASVQLRLQSFSLSQARSRSEHLEVVLPPQGKWLGTVVETVAGLHAQGLRLTPALEVTPPSTHSEEDSVNVSMDSSAVASEDDALFGDLFSETGRHSVNSEEAVQSSSAVKKVDGIHHTLLQSSTQLLHFLEEFPLSSQWHKPTYEVVRAHVSRSHVDTFLEILEMLRSQFVPMLKPSQVEDLDSEGSLDLMLEIQKQSFDALYGLVDQETLSEELQAYLFRQVSRGADGLPRNVLALMAKILINRFSQAATGENDPLAFELWQGFVESIVSQVKASKAFEGELEKVLTVLPSWFQMEVLFMAFHSLDSSSRLAVVELLTSSLSACSKEMQIVGSSVLWAMLISRLLFALKYVLCHFTTFPKWLVRDLSKQLRFEASTAPPQKLSMNEGPFPSWSAIFAQRPAHHMIDEQCIGHLFDVDCSGIDQQVPGLDTRKVKTVICELLGFWSGRVIRSVDELLLEQYLFMLGWSIFQASAEVTELPVLESGNVKAVDSFFRLAENILLIFHRQAAVDVVQWSEFLLQALPKLDVSLHQGQVNLTSWDLLRQGSMVTLLMVPFRLESTEGRTADVLQHIVEAGHAERLLQSLTSILSWYVKAASSCLSSAVSQHLSSQESMSNISLILRSSFQKSRRMELLEKAGANAAVVKALVRWDSSKAWSEELFNVLRKAGAWEVDVRLLPVLLHGFPLCSYNGDATLVSCMMSLEEILMTLARCVKMLQRHSVVFKADGILNSIMTLKVNSVFETLHGHCDTVLNVVLPSDSERQLFNDLYTLKHMEDLLNVLCSSKTVPDTPLEVLVSHVLEQMNGIRTDAKRSKAFSLRYGAAEGQETHAWSMEEGCLSSCIEVLDGCFTESVNQQVLRFLLDILETPSGFQSVLEQQLQERLMSMDKETLGTWLEQRILGSRTNGVRVSASSAVREIALRFLQRISSAPALADHILDAMLMRLERAFVHYDADAARSYLTAVVKMASGGASLKKVSSVVADVISSVPADDAHLECLKWLLSFLSSVLAAHGAHRLLQQTKFSRSKNVVNIQGLPLYKPRVPRGESEQSLQAVEGNGDGDATSVDEDEDDATSDCELTSLDREQEDSNSEKLLASKVCTFTSSGSNFMEQHWYFCYTCDLTVSKGCCSVCAKVCHRGHKVVYSRLSRFFCDCGAGGVRGTSCQCLKPRKYTPSVTPAAKPTSAPEPLFPITSNQERMQLSDSDSETDSDEDCFSLSVSEQEEKELMSLLSSLDLEKQLLALCEKLLRNFSLGIQAAGKEEIQLGHEKTLQLKTDTLQLKRAYKNGSFDMKIKADYSNSRELRSHLLNGSLAKSLLTISSRGRLAAGEGDKVTIFDVGQLIGQPTPSPVIVEKTTVKPLSKSSVRFELVHLLFNPANESYLAVAGYEDCLVFTVNPRGEVTDRLALELALQDSYIRRIAWVAGSQVELMVVTNKFVKIYDLSQDKISPRHCLAVLEDEIIDAVLVGVAQGQFLALVLSQQGVLYSHRISRDSDSGSCILAEVLEIPQEYRHGRGVSLHFSSCYKLLLVSYSDGLTLIGRLNADATGLMEVSSIVDAEPDKKPAGLHHWKEVFDGSGLFSCLSGSKANSVSVVHMRSNKLHVQHLRVPGSPMSLRVDGVSSYRSMAKERSHVLVLYDDGSMHVFFHPSSSGENGGSGVSDAQRNYPAEHIKRLGAAILSARPISPPVFPLDFFEKTTCVTADVKFGGDILRNTDSEGVKLSLSSDDGFVESPSAGGFKLLVFNSNADMVMVGCRVHVGNTSASHIPSELKLFQRSVRLDEGVRCWYDIPFTSSESLLADEEFALTIGPAFNGTSLPRIDSLEVYARTKEDFGWKEKLDAVLDLDSQGQSSSTLANQSASKTKKLLSASTLDQVFYEIFKVLSGYYTLHRLHSPSEDFSFENSKAKCIPVLEAVFASDRQSLLQSAARRALRALSPNKDAYYLTKDMMSLSGVARACPVLAAKLSKGGFRMSLVVQEFTSQVRTVCKVSLHRPSNLTVYLERNGSSIVEKLVSLLWEILVLSEQLEAQTINDLVVLTVDLIYGYAECRSGHLSTSSISPAVSLLKSLLFSSQDAVRSSCSLALSSRLLQVPLPKQTMLVMDDTTDSSRTGSIQSEVGSTAVSSQVMLDEDPGTASVQYCCDGCSIVPIQRRRWHCTVCPDFDLCEACFEVMDADQLPPPHTRDHAMTAIPIEMETGADNNELQYSAIDDMSEENMFQLATQMSLQPLASAAAASPMVEGNDVCDFTDALADAKSGSFSASKRLVNSLLLSGLLENLRGWTRSTSGTSAVPILQLFYRLTTAPSSPLFEGSGAVNLEKVVKFMLDELNIQESMSVRSRSGFGEVAILIFMFLTLLLRHWHQAGSVHVPPKESPDIEVAADGGVQYDRACALLRQQALVNFLLHISQQLVHVFKSSRSQDSGRTSPPCGALLSIRRELAAGSFTPFFTDSYAKSHRGDLFGEFHKLMLESVFRLTYSLLRPGKSDKVSDREPSVSKGCPGPELKLEGWQDVLCGYINNPNTSFVRKYARRLLLHSCGSKNRYYNVRDAWQLNREIKKLTKKADGFQAAIPYERSVKVLKCLSLIGEVASARPRNWQKYCSGHPEVIRFLLNGSFCFGEELVVQTLKLLSLVFYSGKSLPSSKESADAQAKAGGDGKKDKKDGEEATSSSDKSYLDMKQAVEQLVGEDGRNLKNFVDTFLLEWNATSVRSEAKTVLSGAWYHGEEAFRVLLLTLLLDRIPILPSYGQNVQEFTELLSWLLKKGTQEVALSNPDSVLVQGCLTGNTIKKIFETLRSQNELLANHPNSRIYNILVTLVDFDGYYLESEPCLACSSPEIPYTRMKLEAIKAETKFTDNRILVKCTGSHTIQSITMNVHEPRRSKSIKVLNLYYNNRVVADLSELKNNRSLWKRARSCQLNFGQTELKVEFPIPITACNFMIELDCFYENLQAASLESLQCPRCSRVVTDKHGICSNCHENAYQCRQCRNINYENLDSFLCNECGYSKYGRFEFNFMAKPSYTFDRMENDEDMKKGLAAIETESENAHKRYQQLLVYKKPLLKVVSSIGESEVDSQQKDTLQQLVAPPGSKINKKIAILGVLYGEKCKLAFDSVSKSVQNLQGLRRVLMSYLERKKSPGAIQMNVSVQRHPNRCFGCANTFVGHCLEWLQILSKVPYCRQQLVAAGILSELFENNIHQGPRSARVQARTVLSAFTEADAAAVAELNNLIKEKVMYCLEHHRSMDVAACVRDELQLLSETFSLGDDFWEARLRVAFQLLFRSIEVGAKHPVIAEHIILPALKIISQACTPPKTDFPTLDSIKPAVKPLTLIQEPPVTKPAKENNEKDIDGVGRNQELLLVNYVEWKSGATYSDFLRRLKLTQTSKSTQKTRKESRRAEALALKYIMRWKRKTCKSTLADDIKNFQEGEWVRELVLSACSQSIRQEICALIEVLCSQSIVRKTKFLDLFMNLLPASRTAGESAAEYFDLLFKMIETEDARLYLTVRGFLRTSCSLIGEEVVRVEAQERSFHTDISQGYTLHKLIELLNKFLQVPNIRTRFMKDDLLSQVLEALLVIRGLVVQKTKLISDCGRLLNDLLENLLQESYENKKHFLRACVSGLQLHNQDRRDRRCLFILEQICNIICPTKPEPAYMLILNKAHTQEEFIRGSMTKNPYSSLEIGPLMRDVKNKICQQLEMIALLEDDYSMELLVAGSIISLDLSVGQVYEQVWRKAHTQIIGSTLLAAAGITTGRECPPMTVTYRLQGLDGEATEPMIKELDDEREETQDPEIEFAIADVMKESGGLSVLLRMVQNFSDEELRSGHEQVALVLKLLMFCCKIRGNRQALLQLGALDVLLETANKTFSSAESVERLLLIIECLVTEANESDVGVTEGALSTTRAGMARGQQAAKGVLMFLERLSAPSTSKQHRNSDTVARILPFLTYGEQSAMEVLVNHFVTYLLDWETFDSLQKAHAENPKDTAAAQKATLHKFAVDSFVKVTESIKVTASGERLKDLILEKEILSVATAYLKSAFPFVQGRTDHRNSPEWVKALELASVPINLSLMRGLSRGHQKTQEYLSQEGLLPLLHALEAVSGENEIGARAENLLDTLSDKESVGDGFLAEAIMNLRETTRDEMRRRALRRREKLLLELGMSRTLASDGGERIVSSKPKIEGLDDVEEEEAGLACMVCREGYKLRPTDMLGTYSYSKRVNIGSSGLVHGRADWVYTTVSHFNVIHFQCHLEAKRADASLKNPKKEWEGAALRNNETLCNNLFPLRGPAVPLSQYSRCVDTFWDNLNSLGRADGSRLRLLAYDIVLMLGRFATGSSFSTDSKGGGKESNSRLLPFMIQMARHLLDQQGPSQRRVLLKSLQNYLQATPEAEATPRAPTTPGASQKTSGDDNVQYMLMQSLLLHSHDEWQQHRRFFLQRGAVHAYMLHKQGRQLPPVSPAPVTTPRTPMEFVVSFSPRKASSEVISCPDSQQLFKILQSMLVFIGIIDQLQRYFKVAARGSGSSSTSAGTSSSSGVTDDSGEPWEVTMKEKLRDVSSMLAFTKELLEWLSDMQSSQDLQEAVDVMGALGDVLSDGCTSCDEFFRSALGLEQGAQQEQEGDDV